MAIDSVFILATFLVLVFVFSLFILLTQNKRNQVLDKKIDDLWEKLEVIQHDVSALCSGAKGVDERVGGNEKRVRSLLDRLDDLEEADGAGHIQGFQEATKLAQEGASVEDIVEKCHLTIDEADLLVRLYKSSL